MSATDDRRTSRATPGAARTGRREEQGLAFNPDDVHGARLLFVDMTVRSLLAREARQRVVTRMFGVPKADQSFLATMILLAAAVTVLRGVVARPLPHPSGGDAAIGGFALIGALRGLAGPTARNVPFAGVLIAFALLAHVFRPAVAGTVREARALARGGRAKFDARYGTQSAERARHEAPSPSGQGR
jgi:hypothetical protein